MHMGQTNLAGAAVLVYFNPPSPCGEGRDDRGLQRRKIHFNPPSPCGEGPLLDRLRVQGPNFNPPSPCGEGLEESGTLEVCGHDFNPPSPCGEGQYPSHETAGGYLFQSTLPVWGGTPSMASEISRLIFQSTLPVWGGTSTTTWRPINT